MLHMPFIAKLAISNLIIVCCLLVGKKIPALAGLMAAMPLTTLIVLTLLHFDNPGDGKNLIRFVEGVLFGIVPTILFFMALWFCLRRGVPFYASVSAGTLVWVAAAAVHQMILK